MACLCYPSWPVTNLGMSKNKRGVERVWICNEEEDDEDHGWEVPGYLEQVA